MKRSLLESLISVLLATVPGFGVSLAPDAAEAAPPTGEQGLINGIVKDANDNTPIEDAIVILQCSCFDGQQERMTNSRGIYSFTDLPSGNYTIQVLIEKANVSKIVQLPRGAKFRANFAVDPSQDQVIEIVVEASPVPSNPPASMTIGMEEAKQLPVGSNTTRGFVDFVDISPTANSRQPRGFFSFSAFEHNYTVTGEGLGRSVAAHSWIRELERESVIPGFLSGP